MSVTLEAELELMRNKAYALQKEVNDLSFRLGEEIALRKKYQSERDWWEAQALRFSALLAIATGESK